MEKYFKQYRDNIIGTGYKYLSPNGKKIKMIYADWIAGGRLYKPIEDRMRDMIGPFVANTHTETSESGTMMTYAYQYAHRKIKEHVNAGPDDVIITTGSGMTGAINKFQRILGIKLCGTEEVCPKEKIKNANSNNRPVVFITHMEHHSNQTSWLETMAEVVVIPPGDNLLVDPENLRKLIKKYKNRKTKIGSFSACSNVTGIKVPYHDLARIMHENDGACFVDFAASAPYVDINMHPKDPLERLDAVFFSPHKFLGGPGASGVLIFHSSFYKLKVPDHPGGGTVLWTNPWGEHNYFNDIELREDGGTPGFLQAIRAAFTIELKEQMGVDKIHRREKELLDLAFKRFDKIPSLKVLAGNVRDRIGCISFYSEKIHYNLIVKLLSDRYGVQVRGGCTCAGTYGHILLHVDKKTSREITEKINRGDLSVKPGWIRLSIHPTMQNSEIDVIFSALEDIVENAEIWAEDYKYSPSTNEFYHKNSATDKEELVRNWFSLK
jgi:selenocysteine lyase/cysteine desulfurase